MARSTLTNFQFTSLNPTTLDTSSVAKITTETLTGGQAAVSPQFVVGGLQGGLVVRSVNDAALVPTNFDSTAFTAVIQQARSTLTNFAHPIGFDARPQGVAVYAHTTGAVSQDSNQAFVGGDTQAVIEFLKQL